MKKVLIIAGTRPEFIKLASTIKALQASKHEITVVNTGQQRELTDQVIKLFNLPIHHDLNIMQRKQTLPTIIKKIMTKLDRIIRKEKPDMVIVQGDTTTALAGALCTFYNKVKLMHLEAGARTYTKNNPYPEEGNRRMITQIADYHLCQSIQHLNNLKKEGIESIVVGNPSVDALKLISKNYSKKNQILITMHRRDNWGKSIENICIAIKELSKYNDYKFIISCHPNPIVKDTIVEILGNIKNVALYDSLPFDKFINLLAESKIVITDSGGIPPEAAVFKTPSLITRPSYENRELLDRNLAKVVGTGTQNIIKETTTLLENQTIYKNMQEGENPYGDGTTYKKIISKINEVLR